MKNYKEYLFEAIYYSNECADDDTMFLSPKYKKWADEFEVWLTNHEKDKPWKHVRHDHDNCVVFGYDQETIWFADDVNTCPWIMTVFQCYVHCGPIERLNMPEHFKYEP